MLFLTKKVREGFEIRGKDGQPVATFHIMEVGSGRVMVRIDAPREVAIVKAEKLQE